MSLLSGSISISFSKKGRDGHNKNIGVSTGSWGTKNLNISFDGKQENYDYFLEFTHFSTDGQSTMIDNDEKDRYRNDSITANMGYDISDVLRVENYLRYSDYFLEYDEVDEDNLPDDNNTDDQEASYSGRLIIDNGNLKNTLFYNKTIIQRNVRLSEAPSFGESIISYDASSKGANNYLSLAEEIINIKIEEGDIIKVSLNKDENALIIKKVSKPKKQIVNKKEKDKLED